MPSAFSITLGFFPSMTATQEFVVPRSIPITFAIPSLSFWQTVRAQVRHPLRLTRASMQLAWRRSPNTIGAPAARAAGFPRLYRSQAFGPQGEGASRAIKLRFLSDALPGGDQDRGETIIATIGSSVGHLFPERRRTLWIGKPKLYAGSIQPVINADQHVGHLRQRQIVHGSVGAIRRAKSSSLELRRQLAPGPQVAAVTAEDPLEHTVEFAHC